MKGKHAYLVAAHHRFEQLEILLQQLDDPRNDIYLHVDIHAESFSEEQFWARLKHSELYFIERMRVVWGGSSVTDMELRLLGAAINGGYEYYHLISGMDFPIKSQDEIHDFFDRHHGREFVHFDPVTDEALLEKRVGRYHFLQNRVGRTPGPGLWVERGAVNIQNVFGLRRKRYQKEYYRKGSNWFSITGEFADYVLSRSADILAEYRFSECCDELFLQTLLYHSPFCDRCYYEEREQRFSNLRLIDWKRGDPYVFTAGDFDELVNSHCLFARKFDLQLDRRIVERLSSHLREEGESE